MKTEETVYTKAPEWTDSNRKKILT